MRLGFLSNPSVANGGTNDYRVAKSLNILLQTEIPRYPHSRFLFPHNRMSE